MYTSGLVDSDGEVHESNEDAVGGIASTREDFGGDMMQCVGMLHQSNRKTMDTRDDPPGRHPLQAK